MNPVKIILADSQILFKEGIRSVLNNASDYTIVNSVDAKDELFSILNNPHPDSLLIIDPSQLNGFKPIHLRELINLFNAAKILVLTSNAGRDNILQILTTGINHFLLKTCTANELLNALNAIIYNEKYLCREAIEVLLEKNISSSVIKNPEQPHLTKKETEIIQWIARGMTTKEIAAHCFLSIHTVNTHRKNIFRKLEVNNTSELVMFAVKKGIVDTTEYYI